MKEWMQRRIKKFGENIESTITSALFWLIVGGPLVLVATYKFLRDFFLQLLQEPTPLWATTVMIAICCLYTYAKVAKSQSTSIKEDQPCEPPEITNLPEIQVSMLKLLHKKDNLIRVDFYKALEIDPNTATFHLEELELNQMVSKKPHPVRHALSSWKIEHLGLRYLHKIGDIK